MRVFLVRHGETALNAAGVLRGQLDVPLNAAGEAEALALGEVFRGVPLSAVVSSPLRRAAGTAEQLAAASGGPLTTDERLSDRFYGEWAGHRLEEVERRFGSIDAAPLVETWQHLATRAREGFDDAVATWITADEDAVALVTHDAVIRALLARLLPEFSLAALDLPTGSWSELVPRARGKLWRAVRLGEPPANGWRPSPGQR
jgi:probable phosphoglycerate mutase